MREYLTRKIYGGVVFALAIFGTTILAVAISGTIKTWTTGEVLKSADLNTTITSLKTAIEGIPNWTKAANGNDAYYTAGNVGIGTSAPANTLDVGGSLSVTGGSSSYLQFINPNVSASLKSWRISNQGGNGDLYFDKYADSSTYLRTSMFIAGNTGNVGIGTTSPSYPLQISGDISVTNNGVLRFGSAGAVGFTSGTNVLSIGGGVTGRVVICNGNASSCDTGINVINSGGANFVGIGTTTPSQLLTVNGTAGNSTGVWVNNSDERLKKNIQPLGNFLEKLTELRPVTFEWKDPKKLNAKEGKHIGFIAQEVEKVFPYWVDTDKDGMKWLSMEGVNAAFVQSFKEVAFRLRSTSDSVSVVTQKIEFLEKEKAANEKKLLALEEDNKRLRDTVETLRATSLRTSQQLEDRLRAIENTQMAKK
ncbi:MAG: tail fiber domain-containing protein [Leptospiraceae bacterium]|nr:tail fiber domain-containing protein [Leptospiraceae bacterium]MBK9502244.1 tail fiber domain-containing protein [Leptospiraceae bacterium]